MEELETFQVFIEAYIETYRGTQSSSKSPKRPIEEIETKSLINRSVKSLLAIKLEPRTINRKHVT